MAAKLYCLLVLISCSSIYAQENGRDLCNFRSSGIVPDKIPSIPKSIMKVEYNGVSVNCGNLLSRNQTQDPPTVVDYNADTNKLYTLAMIDPDALTPQNPNVAHYRHWVIENIPGNDVKNGDEVSPYYPTAPPDYSDAHRYIFLVYEQPDGRRMEDNFPNEFDKRMHFDHKKFIEDRDLQGPVAGNFFYCHH